MLVVRQRGDSDSQVVEVIIDTEYAERLSTTPKSHMPGDEDKSPAELAGWRYSTAPHLLILCDYGEDDALLQFTIAGVLVEKLEETGSLVDTLEYALSDEVLDRIQINTDPSLWGKNGLPDYIAQGKKCDEFEIRNMIETVRAEG